MSEVIKDAAGNVIGYGNPDKVGSQGEQLLRYAGPVSRPVIDTTNLPQTPPQSIASTPTSFVVKDSGTREQFTSGMVRDTSEGKPDFSLIFDGPMLVRWAEHLRKGAIKYEKRNWMKACGQSEMDRFKESAVRHFFQWMDGQRDEDHAAAVFFNINGVEYVREKLK